MDDRHFDDLTRRLAQGLTRRAAMKGGVAALLAALGLRGHAAAQVSQVSCGNQFCASNPAGCKPGCVCCIYTNSITGTVTNSRCRPPGTCAPGTEAGGATTPPPTTPPPTTPPPTTTTAPPTTTTTTTPQCVTAATCPPPSTACQVATCTNGVCGFSAAANGASCTDGNACTQTDTCQNGVCVGTNPVVCVALDQCHDVGTCNPATGLCSNPDKADGTSCNDDNACTVGDTCRSGVCTGGTQQLCFTANPCATAICDPAVGCTTIPKQAGTPCLDFFKCDGNEACDGAGNCIEGTPVTCGECFACDPASGTCIPATDGTTCTGDGNLCYGSFVCNGGACVGAEPVVCTAQDGCHFAGTCDPATGLCSNPNKPNFSFCTDDNACTSFDSCQEGVCVGSPVDCDDGLPCTLDTCDPATGCRHTPQSGFCLIDGVCVAEGAPCDDGNVCTENDHCRGTGVCLGIPKNCDDGLVCTDDTCVPNGATGECVHTLKPNACFIEGVCYTAGDRNPENLCQGCDPARNQRRWSSLDGVSCDGGCLSGGTCLNGFCAGGEVTNPDSCSIDGICYASGARRPSNTCLMCDPAQSTTAWVWRTQDNGMPCGGLCRDGGTCENGACRGGTVGDGFCEIGDLCIPAGETRPGFGPCWVCDPVSNPFFWTTLADDTPCTNSCVANPTCQAGVCTGAEAIVCPQSPDREFCHRSVCDPQTGGCVTQPIRNGLSDTKGCEVCAGCFNGVCAGQPQPVECGPCGACDEGTGTCVPAPESTDCGSDCTTRRRCDGAGTCVEEPETCGLVNIACEARVCEGGLCVETGLRDGDPCDGDLCRECQGGTCVPKCGRCQQCNPATGTCSECSSSCCDGDCCGPDETCCNDGGNLVCRPRNQECGGFCFSTPRTCCGEQPLGGIKTCDANASCCRTLLGEYSCCPSNQTCCFFGECCPPNYVCGAGGCTPRPGG